MIASVPTTTPVADFWIDEFDRKQKLPTSDRLFYSTSSQRNLRRFVFIRDKFQSCGYRVIKPPTNYDGSTLLHTNRPGSRPAAVLQIDHIIPFAAIIGYSHYPNNLQALCAHCNSVKGKNLRVANDQN